MASTYLFFQPTRLPIEMDDLDADTILRVADTPEVRAKVEEAFPGLQWTSSHRASAEVQGNWYEVHMAESAESTLSLRCSLRANHDAFIQQLCDRFGWLVFDERPMCFQPHRAPFPAG